MQPARVSAIFIHELKAEIEFKNSNTAIPTHTGQCSHLYDSQHITQFWSQCHHAFSAQSHSVCAAINGSKPYGGSKISSDTLKSEHLATARTQGYTERNETQSHATLESPHSRTCALTSKFDLIRHLLFCFAVIFKLIVQLITTDQIAPGSASAELAHTARGPHHVRNGA